MTLIEIHWIDLSLAPDIASLTLSEQDHALLARYGHLESRHRYGQCRAYLRQLLGSALAIPPLRVDIKLGPHGKPFVSGGPAFNLAHCEHWAVIAIAPLSSEMELGIDLEELRPFPDGPTIANHFLAPQETTLLMALEEPRRSQIFLRLWVAKEAVLKQRGSGLAAAMSHFTVDVATWRPDTPLAMQETESLSRLAASEQVMPLNAPQQMIAALSLKGAKSVETRHHNWQQQPECGQN